jgi:hypothetical protein
LYGWKEQKQEKDLKIFYSPLTFNNVNRNSMLQKKGMEIATFLPKAARQFCLLSNWLKVGILAFSSGFPIPFKNCTEVFQ